MNNWKIVRRNRLLNDFNKTFSVGMEFTDTEAAYISQPTETLERNNVLCKIFGYRQSIVIIDAFACVGGDSISLMHAFPSCIIHSVQRSETDEEQGRCARLCRNAAEACKTNPEVTFHSYNCPISTTFSRMPVTAIDLLFLDPPWYLGDTELNLGSMVELLRTDVFVPMTHASLLPEIICMKLCFTASELADSTDFMQMIAGYILLLTVPVTRKIKSQETPVYFFHIYGKHPL